MNILFCNTSNVSEIKGGTERITARVSNGLRGRGHKCFLAYKTEIDGCLPLTTFDGTINVFKDDIERFILDNKIDIIIIQKMTRDVRMFYDIRKKHNLGYKIFSVLHFNPGYEELAMTFSSAYAGMKNSRNLQEKLKGIVRFVTYPIYKSLYPLRNKELYSTVYNYSDKVVLLSKYFIDEYADYCGIKDKSKFEVIPNALSYDEFLPIEALKNKKKQVLIVSRLSETQKRISLAIKIWGMIERNPELEEWNCKIVGAGDSEKDYRELTSQLGLKRVEFCGRQEPKPYYEECKIFLMTSSYEGWGLTLTEAQQFGCVPIAFDTFASLHDIIDDGYNGCVVPDNDLKLYAQKLIELMSSNDNKWQRMAENAIASSKRYQIEKVIDMWGNCINN